MTVELQKNLSDLGKAFEEYKKSNDAVLTEIKTKGSASAESMTKLGAIDTDMNKIRDQIKAIEAGMNRQTRAFEDGSGKGKRQLSDVQLKHQEIMTKFIRGRATESDLAAAVESVKAEHKDLFSMSDADGGYLIPVEMSSEVVKKVFETSDLRPLASVMQIGTNKLEIQEDLDEVDGGWAAERNANGGTNTPKIKMLEIPVHKLEAEPKSTQDMLDDAAVNVDSWLSEKIGSKFGRLENSAFVAGDGIGKPKGFLSYADGSGYGQLQQTESASSGVVVFDDIMDVQGSLKQEYRKNGTWVMQRESFTKIRKLKDLNNQYLWQPSLQAGQPDLILGRPLVEFADMPAIAAGNLAVAFGDFRAGYQIVDRIGIRTQRDNITLKGWVKFYTTKRVGGSVKNFEAIKILKVKS